MKKFSIGLSLIKMTKEEYFKIIDKYKNYINNLYYSPCVDGFFSRVSSTELFRVSSTDELEVLQYARKNGIKLELAINTKPEDEVLKEVLIEEKKRIIPDVVVTCSKQIKIIKEFFPDAEYVLSYNEGIFTIDQIKKLPEGFSSIVIGNRWIRNLEYMKQIKNMGYEVKLMLNNGCSHNCTYCLSNCNCRDVLFFNVAKHTIDVTFAINTIFPFEVHEYYEHMEFIDDYKISNRPCTYDQLEILLYSYINNINEYEFGSYEEGVFLSQMCRIDHYREFLHFLDLKKVDQIKRNEFEIILGGNK